MQPFNLPPRAAADLGWRYILRALASRTVTSLGQAQALELAFLPDAEAVTAALARVEEARGLWRDGVTLPLGGIVDVRPFVARAAKDATLLATEILACGRVIDGTAALRRFARGREPVLPHLAPQLLALPDLGDLGHDIAAAIEPSGNLRDGASPALAQARSRVQGLQQKLSQQIEAYLQDPAFAAHLQDQYFSVRGDRYVLPIVAQARNHVPGIVHNTSNTGQTVFIEPQALIPLGNALAIALSEVRAEEQRILAMFSAELGQAAAGLLAASAQIGFLDATMAAAHMAEDIDATTPRLEPANGCLRLSGVRHPRLLLAGHKVVPNTVALPEGVAALVISGPNAGGKTVSLTAAGLCALMVRAGLPIPAAAGARVPLYDGVHCAIGDAQDMQAGLSSFSAHLHALKDILQLGRQGWLVLIDEIGADTDPQEGAAIARAALVALVTAGTQVLVTTHLEEIKALGVVDARFANARVGFDLHSLRPTYSLEMGAAGSSNALAVAAQVGLPADVLAAAKNYLSDRGLLSAALGQLADQQAALAAERTAAARAREALASERQAVAAQAQALAQAHSRARQEVYAALTEEVAAARADVLQQVAALRQTPDRAAADRLERQLAAQGAALQQQGAVAEARAAAPAPSGPIGVGDWVRIVSLQQEGEIADISGSRATVIVGSLRTRARLVDVVPATRQEAARPRRREPVVRLGAVDPALAVAAGSVGHVQARCDLRGLRLDAAERALEKALDQCLSEGLATLWVVHGHGTGVLRQGVRELLEMSPYVATMRPADAQEGGDGVTVVTLRR